MKPHSIYVAAVGGDDKEIAQTIWKYAGSGCDFNGNTNVIIYDENYAHPKPKYEVSFIRPGNINLHLRVRVRAGGSSFYEKAVKDAVTDIFQNRRKGKIGATVYAVDFVCGLNVIEGVTLVSVEIGTNAGNLGGYVTAPIDKIPVIRQENIQVVEE